LPAILTGSRSPSLKLDEVSVKAACAFAPPLLNVKAIPAANTKLPIRLNANMTFPLCWFDKSFFVFVRGLYRGVHNGRNGLGQH
jgi:hypothetical protein